MSTSQCINYQDVLGIWISNQTIKDWIDLINVSCIRRTIFQSIASTNKHGMNIRIDVDYIKRGEWERERREREGVLFAYPSAESMIRLSQERVLRTWTAYSIGLEQIGSLALRRGRRGSFTIIILYQYLVINDG